MDTKQTERVFSKVDLDYFVRDMNERMTDEAELTNEMQILQNALDFSKIKARDCLIPRTEIIALDVDEEMDILRSRFIETGLSKIIIYRDSIDNVIGYVHSFELFKKPQSIKQILLPIPIVPEAMPGKELLELFARQSGNIAIVVDEFGGTSGLITIEDLMEEIFGDIEDEHDKEDLTEEEIEPGVWLFSARQEIDYLNEEFELALPESEEYDTLGGMVLHHIQGETAVGHGFDLLQKIGIRGGGSAALGGREPRFLHPLANREIECSAACDRAVAKRIGHLHGHFHELGLVTGVGGRVALKLGP
jgi:CBS domain containing-hemolysin-like protein